MGKRAKKRIRIEQGYERNPPRCGNCYFYSPPLDGVPNQTPYRAPYCNLGKFATGPVAICDKWSGKDGSELDS